MKINKHARVKADKFFIFHIKMFLLTNKIFPPSRVAFSSLENLPSNYNSRCYQQRISMNSRKRKQENFRDGEKILENFHFQCEKV